MLALLLPIVNSLIGGVITPFMKTWADYKRTELTTSEAGFAAASIIGTNAAAVRLAPPTNAPSTSGTASNSAAFAALTEPP